MWHLQKSLARVFFAKVICTMKETFWCVVGFKRVACCTDEPIRLQRDVVLLTNDRNLRLKAHTHNVPTKTVPQFMHWAHIHWPSVTYPLTADRSLFESWLLHLYMMCIGFLVFWCPLYLLSLPSSDVTIYCHLQYTRYYIKVRPLCLISMSIPLTLTPTDAIWVCTAIKCPVPDRVKLSFVIFNIRALWRSGLIIRVPGCQKITNDSLTRSGTGCFIVVPI